MSRSAWQTAVVKEGCKTVFEIISRSVDSYDRSIYSLELLKAPVHKAIGADPLFC